jgi:translation initiation factor 3 subunit H
MGLRDRDSDEESVASGYESQDDRADVVEILPEQAPVATVRLDGLVLLKIINHCSDNIPDVVSGQLLGLDVDGVLEVANCFPIPTDNDDKDGMPFEETMMKCMRTVNVDCNVVGWFQSGYLGTFLTPSFIESQYEYQEALPNSVVIVYDPVRTARSKLVGATRAREQLLPPV